MSLSLSVPDLPEHHRPRSNSMRKIHAAAVTISMLATAILVAAPQTWLF